MSIQWVEKVLKITKSSGKNKKQTVSGTQHHGNFIAEMNLELAVKCTESLTSSKQTTAFCLLKPKLSRLANVMLVIYF